MEEAEREKAEDKRLLAGKYAYPLFGLIGVLFVFFMKAENGLARTGNIVWTGGYIIRILGVSLIGGGLLGSAVCFLCRFCMIKYESGEDRADSKNAGSNMHADRNLHADRNVHAGKNVRPGKVFFIALLLILLCWIPCYLAYYPAICAYDANVQTGQAVSGEYNDHHPIAHTLLVAGAMKAGEKIFGNVNTGIAVYGALQMLFLAGVSAYGISRLHHYRVRLVFLVLVLLYCMLYPFHWYMSVSMIKDTVFSAFFLLQMIAFYEILKKRENTFRPGTQDVIFGAGTVGMILFRNNGKYAMMVLLVFLLGALWRGKDYRKFWGRLLINAGFMLAAGNLLLTLLFHSTGAEQGDKREMLSMPIQQMARCMIYHGGIGVLAEDDASMDETDKALINDFLLNESYREYRPDISDPVKRHTNTYVPRYRSKEFLTVYLHLFAEYPGDYINAALAVNAGYLSPLDVSHAVINDNGVERGLGYVQTRWVENELNPRGIYKDSRWRGLYEKLEDWADRNAYLNIPVLKYMFVPGAFLWIYLLLAGCLALGKKYRMIMPLSLVLGYYITLFLGPAVQLRYIYPLMLALPFVILLGGKEEECGSCSTCDDM